MAPISLDLSEGQLASPPQASTENLESSIRSGGAGHFKPGIDSLELLSLSAGRTENTQLNDCELQGMPYESAVWPSGDSRQ